MVQCLREGREREAHRIHRQVHFAWYAAADSPWLLHLVSEMWAKAERYLRRAPHLRDSAEIFGDEH